MGNKRLLTKWVLWVIFVDNLQYLEPVLSNLFTPMIIEQYQDLFYTKGYLYKLLSIVFATVIFSPSLSNMYIYCMRSCMDSLSETLT